MTEDFTLPVAAVVVVALRVLGFARSRRERLVPSGEAVFGRR
jgi:hypothetical protein